MMAALVTSCPSVILRVTFMRSSMMLWVGVILTSLLFLEVQALSLSHYDLEGANRTCYGKESCDSKGSDPRLYEEANWLDRNCQCDKLCAMYGDCCVDSAHFHAAEQRRGAASFTCVNLKQYGGVYMVTSCPAKWNSMRTRRRCEMTNPADPVSTLPVTSHVTGVTYRNVHCALCHGDVDNTTLDFWKPRLECPSLLLSFSKASSDNLTEALVWDPTERFWGLNLTQWHRCFIDPVIPERSNALVRRCQENTIHTCAVNWTNVDVRNRCEAYTSLVYEGANAYRNPHCAVCNNVPLQSLTCFKITLRSFYNKDFSPNAFAILFDLLGHPDGAVGKVKPCAERQLFDPFFKKCRDVLCPKQGQEFVGEKCLVHNNRDAADDDDDDDDDGTYYREEGRTGNRTYSHLFVRCPKFVLSPESYELVRADNTTVYVSAYERYFTESEYRLHEDDSLEICAGTLGTRLVNKFGRYMGYVTAVGLGVSIIFLVLHLIAFTLVSDLQNLGGKNLASLCFALLIADCSFVSGQGISTGTTACIASSIITYYGFLASFFWMLTLAFDIWRTLKIATFELRVSSGKQWRKFFLYSFFSWVTPALLMIASVVTDFSPIGSVNVYLRPLFGVHSCWFGHRQSLLLFFAAPLAVIMILNIIFFSSSAHMIFSTTSTTRYTASGATQRDFRLYIRLALVMGLTWITGLLGGYLDIDALWYSFIALNTLQGLFIFLAFTCNDKVIRGIRECTCGKWNYDKDESHVNERRPPSFSWSGDSSDSTNKSNLESTSDESSKQRNISNEFNSAPRSIKHFDSPFNSLELSKDNFEINTQLAYDTGFRSKNFDIFPPVNYGSHPAYGTNPKINPIYGSANKDLKNATFDRRHLDDTLY